MSRILCDGVGTGLSFRVASTFLSRTLGLLVGPALGNHEALLITRCSCIHTIGMSYPIDVVFLDGAHEIVRVVESVRPGRLIIRCQGARHTLEVRAGTARAAGLIRGEVLGLGTCRRCA